MAFVLIAKFTVREGEEERVLQLAEELVAKTREEPGNILYIPHRDPEDPRVLLVYEQYRDREAFEAHGASEHFQDLAVGQIFPLLENRERNFYETID
jgi:quinol monooxygenase YgiN